MSIATRPATWGTNCCYTKRYHLGQLLGGITRHFLLMTATPHNGKEEDFQLFMALLDADRFEGKYRDSVHSSDTSDLMRPFRHEPDFAVTSVNYNIAKLLQGAEANLAVKQGAA